MTVTTSTPKVTLCHATGSAGNPYVEITVDDNSTQLEAHAAHPGDVIPAPEGGCEALVTTTTTTIPSTTTTIPSTTTTDPGTTTTVPEGSTTTSSPSTTAPEDTTTTVVLVPPTQVERHPDTGTDLALVGPGVIALLLGSAILAAVRHRRRPAT